MFEMTCHVDKLYLCFADGPDRGQPTRLWKEESLLWQMPISFCLFLLLWNETRNCMHIRLRQSPGDWFSYVSFEAMDMDTHTHTKTYTYTHIHTRANKHRHLSRFHEIGLDNTRWKKVQILRSCNLYSVCCVTTSHPSPGPMIGCI